VKIDLRATYLGRQSDYIDELYYGSIDCR